jgi:diguanylate cyclase (GGDEF)-like protein
MMANLVVKCRFCRLIEILVPFISQGAVLLGGTPCHPSPAFLETSNQPGFNSATDSVDMEVRRNRGGTVGLRSTAWKYALIGGMCVVAVYFALPNETSQDIVYSVLGSASVVCILVGIRLHRPKDRLSWYFLALAGTCFTLGDDASSFYNLLLHVSVPFPSFADALYLAGYPFLFAGVLRLTRNPNRSYRRENYADAAIVSMGALAISWHFLMNSYVHDATLTTFGMLVDLAYPIMDIALLFILFRALLFGESRRTFHKLLAAAMIVMFVGDFIYDLLVLHNGYDTGNPSDALFLIEYVLIGVAALHPSVAGGTSEAEAADVVSNRQVASDRHRMPIVIVAGFIPPTILVVATSLGVSVNVLVLAGLCIAVFAVICLRMIWLIGRISRQSLELKENDANLRYMAYHDELTGLANRGLLHDRVEQALASITRSGRLVALCMGDLDGFKTINDTLGHHVGDTVLVKVGALLESIVRPGDTVARLGGDEFAILMVDVENPNAAVEFAGRIVSVLHDAVEFEGNQAGISISVGVAFADSTTPVEQVISEADAAMYEAKANGKNRVDVYQSSMRALLFKRLELTSGFRGSLERSEFFLNFQPIFSLGDRRLRGFEALVRWQHPTIGLVAPLDFIPIAEETGFIVPLGRWILLAACEQLAAWTALSNEPLTVAVNLSRRQLASPLLVDNIHTALALTGVHPQQLVLEVTESVLMENPEQAASALTELRALGIRIAVDDFGTGFSSLSYLQRFPVDVLKIDKSFVDPLNESEPASSALVTSIIGLAHSLSLEVVAEGIEREDQFERLIELGCDYGQGYLMARPLDREKSEAFVESYQVSAAAP